jgi:hypothetical protein
MTSAAALATAVLLPRGNNRFSSGDPPPAH